MCWGVVVKEVKESSDRNLACARMNGRYEQEKVQKLLSLFSEALSVYNESPNQETPSCIFICGYASVG